MAFLRVIPTASHRKAVSWFVACPEQLPHQQKSVAPPSAEAAHDSSCVSSSCRHSAPAFRHLDRATRHSRLGPWHAQRTKSRARELGGPYLGRWRRGRSREARRAFRDPSRQSSPHAFFSQRAFLPGGS